MKSYLRIGYCNGKRRADTSKSEGKLKQHIHLDSVRLSDFFCLSDSNFSYDEIAESGSPRLNCRGELAVKFQKSNYLQCIYLGDELEKFGLRPEMKQGKFNDVIN